LRARLEQRRGHYVPSSLLASQLAAPGRPGDAITVDVSGTPEAIVEQIRVAAARLND
jgi:gluconokinase